MTKISILEKFAQDAINAPALVTGGKKCGGSGKNTKNKKSNKGKKSGSGSGNRSRSGSGSRSNKGGTCYVEPPCKW